MSSASALILAILGVLGRVVDGDAVDGPGDLAVEERLVVGGIEPGQRARHEGLVELGLAYSSALIVSGLLMTTWSFSSTILPPNDHTSQWHQPLASPTALPSARPPGLPLGGQRLRDLEHAVEIGRPGVEAGFLQRGDAVDDAGAGGTQRNGDPLAVAHAELPADVVPAAVLLIEILGEVGDVDELVRILMGVVVPAIDDIRALADIGGHRRLRTQILPALALDLDLHAGLPGVFLGVLQPQRLVALDELGRPQHAQAGARLGLQVDRRLLRARRPQPRFVPTAAPASRPAPTFSESRLVKSFIASSSPLTGVWLPVRPRSTASD